MAERKRLTDILTNSEREAILRAWDETQAAPDLGPLPEGTYTAKLVSAEFFTARTGTPGVKVLLVVIEPADFAGRKLFSDHWLTPAAMPGTKRDLIKLGIHDLEMLNRPVPEGLIVECRVGLRRDDGGTERNVVRRFDLIRVDPPPPNPFGPAAADTPDPDDDDEVPF